MGTCPKKAKNRPSLAGLYTSLPLRRKGAICFPGGFGLVRSVHEWFLKPKRRHCQPHPRSHPFPTSSLALRCPHPDPLRLCHYFLGFYPLLQYYLLLFPGAFASVLAACPILRILTQLKLYCLTSLTRWSLRLSFFFLFRERVPGNIVRIDSMQEWVPIQSCQY